MADGHRDRPRVAARGDQVGHPAVREGRQRSVCEIGDLGAVDEEDEACSQAVGHGRAYTHQRHRYLAWRRRPFYGSLLEGGGEIRIAVGARPFHDVPVAVCSCGECVGRLRGAPSPRAVHAEAGIRRRVDVQRRGRPNAELLKRLGIWRGRKKPESSCGNSLELSVDVRIFDSGWSRYRVPAGIDVTEVVLENDGAGRRRERRGPGDGARPWRRR